MTAAVAAQCRVEERLVNYKGRTVRLTTGPNAHDLCHCHEVSPQASRPAFAGYASCRQLREL